MFVDLGDIGAFLIALGFSAALVSAGAYAMQLRRPNEGLIRLARGGFYAMVFAVMFGAAILMRRGRFGCRGTRSCRWHSSRAAFTFSTRASPTCESAQSRVSACSRSASRCSRVCV